MVKEKKKITRKELLKGPDEFVTFSNRAATFVREHTKEFSYAGWAILALAVIYLGSTTYLDYADRKGQESYNTAYYALVRNMKPEPSQEDITKWEALFRETADRHGSAKVSRLAYPELAYLKFLEKKYDEAVSLYQQFLDKVPEGSPYQSLTRLAMAACYEEKGDFQKAIEALEKALSSPDESFSARAMWGLSRVYGLSNQPEKAKEMLKGFVEKHKQSPYLPLAKARLNEYGG